VDGIKIKWVAEERQNYEIGRVITGGEYIVTPTLGYQLISQGFAVEVKPAAKPKEAAVTKHKEKP